MTANDAQIEPLIALKLRSPQGIYHPGDVVEYEYQIDAVDSSDIQAVETSVMWYTEGKGDEDLGVHHFERSRQSDAVDGDLRQLQIVRTALPPSPLSYNGAIVKIRWCVRVRVFWGRGKDTFVDRQFQLQSRPFPAAATR